MRALPRNIQQLMIGDGITRVKFRLLEGVRDPNYAKMDSGERHVFEILRVAKSLCRLWLPETGVGHPGWLMHLHVERPWMGLG